MECRSPCCLYVQKIHERVENEEKEVKPTFHEELNEIYKILKKRNEEIRKSIRKIKNVYKQYLPKMRNRICLLEATVNELQRKRESTYFGYEDRDGYNQCRSDICSIQRKMESLHQCYEDCVREAIEHHSFIIFGYSARYTFELFMQKFEKLLTHGETTPEEWMRCYEIIVKCMENDWYVKRWMVVPEKIQELMRKCVSDDDEHSSLFCDLTDCTLCEARKYIEESYWSDDYINPEDFEINE